MLVACHEDTQISKQSNKNNAYTKIHTHKIQDSVTILETTGYIENAKSMWDLSEVVALVEVDSILGGDNQINEVYVYPFTYGTMKIKEIYKGSIEDRVGYVRMGGIVTVNKYIESIYENKMTIVSNQFEYVKETCKEDIEIEVGKTYLVYLANKVKYTRLKQPTYTMFGWQGGLREVKETLHSKEVLNNFTGEWEDLEIVVPTKK